MLRKLIFVCLLGAMSSCLAVESDFDLGCFFFRGDDIEDNHLVRAAGPFFEYRDNETNTTLWALRPLYSLFQEEDHQRQLHEVLWPVGMLKYHQNETYWRFLTAYGHDFDTQTPASRYHVTILPIWFNGRDAHGENYFALFPIGGRINEFMGRDTVSFVLFPLYGYSRINDVESHSILWPIFSRTSGPNIEKLRVFPLYGYASKRDWWTKQFVLWPFWTSVRYHAPERHGQGFVLFPLYGHLKVGEDVESWMIIPPLFRFSRDKEHREFNAPWPLFQYASGDYEKLYAWPLWGKKTLGPVDSWFCLWPIVSGERIDRKSYMVKRFLILPFVQHETRTAVPDEGPREDSEASGPVEVAPMYRFLKLWPLFNYCRSDDETTFRLLALWPFKNARSVNRNYAPLWTLYSHASTGETKQDELLWGLFRWRRDTAGSRTVTVFPLFSDTKRCDTEPSRKWQVLFGLAGYEREGTRKTYRLLYFLKWQRGYNDAEP